jgi:hypothetical protein
MASGQTLATVMPRMMEYPISGRGSAATEVLGGDSGHCMAAFDDGLAQWSYFNVVMPRFYSGGPLAIRLAWTSAQEMAPKAVVWAVFLERLVGIDLDADYITGTYGYAAAYAAGWHPHTVVFSDAFPASPPGLWHGERFRVAVARDGAHAYDTMLGEAHLHSVEIREQ